MSDVKTGAMLPKGEPNGLAEIATDLIKDPRQLRPVIGFIDCRRVTTDSDTGEQVATVRFRRIETLLPGDLAAAEQLIRRALASRSGQEQLTLELEDEISSAFAGLDVDTMAAEEAAAKDDPEGQGDDGGPADPDDEAPKS